MDEPRNTLEARRAIRLEAMTPEDRELALAAERRDAIERADERAAGRERRRSFFSNARDTLGIADGR